MLYRRLLAACLALGLLLGSLPAWASGHSREKLKGLPGVGVFCGALAAGKTQVVGGELDVLVTTPDRREEARRITQQLVSGEGVHLVTQRCRQDGALVDVEVWTVPAQVGRRKWTLYQHLSRSHRIDQGRASHPGIGAPPGGHHQLPARFHPGD